MTKARRRGRTRIRLLLASLLLGGCLILADKIALPLPQLPPRTGAPIEDVRSWGYQLQKVRASRIPASTDLLVVDYSRDGSGHRAFTREDVEKLRRRPDGTRRTVLAYMSVGEAESYRYYWWSIWRFIGPSWLGHENEQWPGNYPVRFWQTGWQRTIMYAKRSALDALLELVMPWRRPYIDRILDAGFDGVYLDRVDVYGEWDETNDNADKDMVRFVAVLSAYAKTRKLGFLIVPQNGEELLRFKNYRKVIDGVAKEDLYYGVEDDGDRNSSREVAKSLRHLKRASKDGLPVFVVEYLKKAKQKRRVQRLAVERGFILNFARRALDKPPKPLPDFAAAGKGAKRHARSAPSASERSQPARNAAQPALTGAPPARPAEGSASAVKRKTASRQTQPAVAELPRSALPRPTQPDLAPATSGRAIVPPIRRVAPRALSVQ